jgi:MFS transporter, putative metabolite transport protein
MNNNATAEDLRQTNIKSVLDYIDEQPMWPDGTRIASIPMTKMQWRIWSLAAAGKFFEGFVVFMTGVALPLILRVRTLLHHRKPELAPRKRRDRSS